MENSYLILTQKPLSHQLLLKTFSERGVCYFIHPKKNAPDIGFLIKTKTLATMQDTPPLKQWFLIFSHRHLASSEPLLSYRTIIDLLQSALPFKEESESNHPLFSAFLETLFKINEEPITALAFFIEKVLIWEGIADVCSSTFPKDRAWSREDIKKILIRRKLLLNL